MYLKVPYSTQKNLFQIEWDDYFEQVFADTEVFLSEEEKIIVKEPEFLDGFLPILIATPADVVGS